MSWAEFVIIEKLWFLFEYLKASPNLHMKLFLFFFKRELYCFLHGCIFTYALFWNGFCEIGRNLTVPVYSFTSSFLFLFFAWVIQLSCRIVGALKHVQCLLRRQKTEQTVRSIKGCQGYMLYRLCERFLNAAFGII